MLISSFLDISRYNIAVTIRKISSVAIKKGSREGTTDKAQRTKPFLAAVKLSEENSNKNKVKIQIHVGRIIFFNLKIKTRITSSLFIINIFI